MLVYGTHLGDLLPALAAFQPPRTAKWIEREDT
jgi:hypothetical protein